MQSKKALLVLGGTWHKFEPFAQACAEMLPGLSIETTYDLRKLCELGARHDLVIMYTCLSATREDGSPAAVLCGDEHAAPLAEWVSRGGALLMVHSATVACQSSPVLRKLAGGVFVGHPPAFTFTVYPMAHAHPITSGVGAFSVQDEFYVQEVEDDIAVHMIALDRGVAHPMVWTRHEQRGRVANIAMGHDERVWALPPYRQLMKQAAEWVMSARG